MAVRGIGGTAGTLCRVAYVTTTLSLMMGSASPAGSATEEEVVQLIVEVGESDSKKEVKDAGIDVISIEEPEKFSMKSSKTDAKGIARFKVPRGKVVVQVNAKAHDPKAVQVIVGKDAEQSVKIVLESREVKKKK